MSQQKLKLSIVFGTRPELIKVAPIILLARQDSRFEVEVIFTGQHDELVRDAIDFFHIQIDQRLNMMSAGQSLNQLLLHGLQQLESVFADGQQRDAVIVQGDTTTVLAAGLTAFSLKIPVAHVEAGLRSYDLEHPFPEEGNRQLVSRLVRWHFAPTVQSQQNLLNEAIPAAHIHVTGNTVVDAVRLAKARLSDTEGQTLMSQLGLHFTAAQHVVLVTAHRRENFGEGLRNICESIQELAERYPDLHFVWPVHLNPAVHQVVHQYFADHQQVHLLPPLDYPNLLNMMRRACFVMSDSGGLQEESPSFHKPILILRTTTERPEVVDVGAGYLVGTDKTLIVQQACRLLDDPAYYASMSQVENPFGDGFAAERILQQIYQDTF